jgi:hypothetical protein
MANSPAPADATMADVVALLKVRANAATIAWRKTSEALARAMLTGDSVAKSKAMKEEAAAAARRKEAREAAYVIEKLTLTPARPGGTDDEEHRTPN